MRTTGEQTFGLFYEVREFSDKPVIVLTVLRSSGSLAGLEGIGIVMDEAGSALHAIRSTSASTATACAAASASAHSGRFGFAFREIGGEFVQNTLVVGQLAAPGSEARVVPIEASFPHERIQRSVIGETHAVFESEGSFALLGMSLEGGPVTVVAPVSAPTKLYNAPPESLGSSFLHVVAVGGDVHISSYVARTDGKTESVPFLQDAGVGYGSARDAGGGMIGFLKGIGPTEGDHQYETVELWVTPDEAVPAPRKVATMPFDIAVQTTQGAVGGAGRYAASADGYTTSVWNLSDGSMQTCIAPEAGEFGALIGISRNHLWTGVRAGRRGLGMPDRFRRCRLK